MVARTECASRTLAMHQQRALFSIDSVLLQLGSVVRDVVDHSHPEIFCARAEYLRKNFADAVEDHLPVRERHVEPTLHRREIIAPLRRLERRARELAVENLDAVFAFHHFQKGLEIIGRNLVPETAAAAVEHHDDLVRDRNSELRRELFVAHVFGPRDLHFEVMVSAADRADLVIAPIDSALADFPRVRAGDASVFLSQREVVVPAITVFDAPARTLLDYIAKFLTRQFHEPVAADARRHALKKKIDNLLQTRLHVLEREVGDDEAHAAVDIESDSTR